MPGTDRSDLSATRLLCHLAFWFGLVFATPLFVTLHNVSDIGLDPAAVAAYAAPVFLALALSGWIAGLFLPGRYRTAFDTTALVAAILIAVWGNLLNDLHEFGVFDGRPIDFRDNKAVFWLEWLAWILGAGLLFRVVSRMRRIPAWLPLLPILSFAALLVPPVLEPPQSGLESRKNEPVDPSVYAFSSIFNLVHLLPDGFQGDTVRQAFANEPGLAGRFEGFTLYTDHLGSYVGTAPSLYTLLTGDPFPLERGFRYSWVGPEIRERSYQAELARQGFQIDLVPISNYICPENADSCHPRKFKNFGYSTTRNRSVVHSLYMLADMTLFRLSPMFLKEKIYDRGYWLLSDISIGDDAPVPDPVLREWTDKMVLTDERPVYKWYHYVGTHVPPHWNRDCRLVRGLKPEPENYVAQARCILSGIADFIDRLKAEGIYDQTAIIITGDHGHNTVPADQVSEPLNYGMYAPLLGTGRPALLVKPASANGPLALSSRPTHLLNITPTVQVLAGLPKRGQSVDDIPESGAPARVFQHYPVGPFWSGNPVPYLEYEIQGPAHRADAWRMTDIVRYGDVPSAYQPVNRETARNFVYGARLRKSFGQTGSSWVRGRQLAFAAEIPGSEAGPWLELELAFPGWIESQSFTVRVNGGSPWRSGEITGVGSGDNWINFRVPVSAGDLRDGPDFVSVLFDRSYEDPGGDERASARVRGILTGLSSDRPGEEKVQ